MKESIKNIQDLQSESIYAKQLIKHIRSVRFKMGLLANLIRKRSRSHDSFKFKEDILTVLSNYNLQLSIAIDEDEILNLEKKIELINTRNAKHPAFHKNGINNMTLVDIIEMFSDWLIIAEEKNLDTVEFLEDNCKQFKISSQVLNIFINTLPLIKNK